MKIRNSFVANSSSSSFLIIFADEKAMLEIREKFLDLIVRNVPSITSAKSYYKARLQLLRDDIEFKYCAHRNKKTNFPIIKNTLNAFYFYFYQDIVTLNKIKESSEKNNSFFVNLLSDNDFTFYKLIANLTEKNIITEIIEE